MVDTPWGPSESLRDRMLRPGPGTHSQEVARQQRERLFAAMAASVAERGYAATRVTDLVELSGISRRTFYALFPDKLACFKAAVEELAGITFAAAYSPELDEMAWEQRAKARLDTFLETVTRHPAAARMCLVEAHAAGPEATKPLEDAIAAVEAVTAQSIRDSPPHAGAPPELIAAAIRAAVEFVSARLRRGEEADLPALAPELLQTLVSYRLPPQPLRLATRPPGPSKEDLNGHDHADRVIRAFAVVVAECGYAGTTIDQVVKRASMSPTTFYANFSGREDLLIAAIETAGAQISAAVLPAYRRTPDWPTAVRAAIGSLFTFLASRPALAQLVMVEVHGAGDAAIERRDDVLTVLQMILGEARQRAPRMGEVAAELIATAISALTYKQIREGGPASLPALAPICTYLVLAPVVGPERACEAANGDGRTPAAEGRLTAVQRRHASIMNLLKERDLSAAEVARELGVPLQEVSDGLEDLSRAGMVERPQANGRAGGTPPYRSRFRILEDPEWFSLSEEERHRISAQIGYMIMEEVDRAVKAGTFDGRPDRYLARSAFVVDDRGWGELIALHDRTLRATGEIVAASEERLRASAEPGIEGRSIQTLFEMPGNPPAEA